jgi:hypothetical protein
VAVGDETVSVRRIVAVGVYLPVLGVLSVLRALSAPVAVNLVAVDVDLEGRGHLFGASCDFPAHRCDILDALDRALGRPRLVLGGLAYLLDAVVRFLDRVDDGLERRRRLANDAGPLVDPRVRLADGRDLRLDLGGGRLRFLREILDFVRDDREPLAGLARAGGLDGGSALDGSGIKPLCRDSQ